MKSVSRVSRGLLLMAAWAFLLGGVPLACSDSPSNKVDAVEEVETSELDQLPELDQVEDELELLPDLIDQEDDFVPECSSAEQCASGVCDIEQGVCLEPSCEDGVLNGDESDADCGGACLACADERLCRDDGDCESGNCDNESGRCVAPACDDGILNGGERDTDCGGACAACANGMRCLDGVDCESGLCLDGYCQAEHCSSGSLDGDETDVDCGGSCVACGAGLACVEAADCESLVCIEGFCAAASCSDGVLNGDEVDVDCAGSCPACPEGSRCVSDEDCAEGSCYLDLCQPESCANGALDAGETDVDCGGACEPCDNGKACLVDADCLSGICVDLLCRGETLVHFDAQGGSTPNPATLMVRFGQPYGEFPETSRSGFGFAGWWTEAGEGGELVTPETVVTRIDEHTLYAHWSAATVTVSFAADGGSAPDPASKQVVVNAPYGPLATTTRDGYTFGGWWTQPGGVGELVTSSSIVLIPTDHTLYPRWSVNSYTVTFDAQGGTAPNPASKVVEYGESYGPLAATSRVGYTFGGWWTAPDGGGSEVLEGTVMQQLSDHTLYAKWTANTYTVMFDVQGGTTSDPTTMTVTHGVAYGPLPAVTRTGYSFGGWWTQPGGAGTAVTAATIVSATADHTLYAAWSANSYTVSFDSQGGSAPNPASKSVTFGSTYGSLATTTRTGYTFAGWWTAASGGSEIQATTVVTATADHTLYARWTANTYTVSFNSQGGSAANPATKTVTFGGTYGTLATTTRAGYTFGGWWTAASGGSQVLTGTVVTATSDHTLHARWTANTYTVTFDPQFGSAPNPAAKTVTFGGTYGSLPSTTRAGYSFVGWYTAAAGGTQVQSSTTVTTASNHTLYARWSALSFQVTFDPQGGSTPVPATKSVTFGGTYGTLATTTRSGHTFQGWWTLPGGTGSQVFDTTPVSTPSNHSLYAKWSTATNPGGVTALCDPGWLNTDIRPSGLGLTCDSPAFPGQSNWFDFDAGQKVAPGDLAGDLNKDLYFEVENGAVQVDTGIPASQFASVTCSSSDGRVYGTTGVDHFVETVVCLRTALGTYVKWYSMAGSTGTGGVAITWERMSSVPSGTTALCDPGWLNTDIVPSGLGLTCDSPAFPGVSNWFDFDAGQKVAPSASTADLRKEGMWEVVNGATQVDTGIPSSQFGSVVCSSSDGRPYSSGGVMYNLTTVICLRTALGVYVKWYSMAGAGGTGGSAITWTRM